MDSKEQGDSTSESSGATKEDHFSLKGCTSNLYSNSFILKESSCKNKKMSSLYGFLSSVEQKRRCFYFFFYYYSIQRKSVRFNVVLDPDYFQCTDKNLQNIFFCVLHEEHRLHTGLEGQEGK